MSNGLTRHGSFVAMEIAGILMILAALMWFVLADDPMPMGVVLAGGGVVFLGAGAAIRQDRR